MSTPLEGAPIPRRSLHDEVVERVRTLIIDGEIEPGARVPERELCERLAISRTPLREALKVLARDGFVELLPNRGARVARLTDRELDDAIEVMAALEGLAGELAAIHATDAEIRAIEHLHAVMLSAHEREDARTYFSINRTIHEAILKASRNATLEAVYTGVSGRLQRTRFRAVMTPEQWRAAVDEHDRMVRLLKARDGARLGELMRDHMRNKKPVIRSSYGVAAQT